MTSLSILIPARNEMFLARTVQDILEHSGNSTEVIVVLDGVPADPPLPVDPRVRVIWHDQSTGQRASTNEAARMSQAKYVMKVDAHCAFDQDFDAKLMAPYESGELGMDVTTIPRMYNLHVFDWVCKACGSRKYQGPKPETCDTCKSSDIEMDVVWKPRWNRRSDFARFDRDLHFQYWGAYEKRSEAKPAIADVMCCVGAAWMMPRERYWQIDGMDERHGSWGQMGVELACKSWLSGGRQVVNKHTWFAHLFRTQPGFGFPYHLSGSAVDKARTHSRWLWQGNNWEKAIHPLSWLIEKFAPVPDWEQTKGMVYYTENRLEPRIAHLCRQQLLECSEGKQIVSVSLQPLEGFGDNIVLPLERGYLTMFKQILAGLEASRADIVFLTEHDVLYHPSHFEFVPPDKETFYYNENVWKVDVSTGRALFYYVKQTSGLCAYRSLLIEHYRKRVEIVERDGFSRRMGFEPGTHRPPRGVDNYPAKSWMSTFPNIDIRHNTNLTSNRWRKDQFRNQKYTEGWTEAEEVPGWGRTFGRFDEFLRDLAKE